MQIRKAEALNFGIFVGIQAQPDTENSKAVMRQVSL